MNSLELIKLNKHYGRKHALKIFHLLLQMVFMVCSVQMVQENQR